VRRALFAAGLLLSVSALGGCGQTRVVVSVQTVTVRTLPGVPDLYANVLGIYIPLTLEQMNKIGADIASYRRSVQQEPDIGAAVANVELHWEPGDPIRSVRVTYTLFCSHTEGIGYEEVRIDERGRETSLSSAPDFDPESGDQLCVTPS
jgi:hypothetical protein